MCIWLLSQGSNFYHCTQHNKYFYAYKVIYHILSICHFQTYMYIFFFTKTYFFIQTVVVIKLLTLNISNVNILSLGLFSCCWQGWDRVCNLWNWHVFHQCSLHSLKHGSIYYKNARRIKILVLTLYLLNFLEGTKTCICISCHSSTLTWLRLLKSFPK